MCLWRVVLWRYHDTAQLVVQVRKWVRRRRTCWSSPRCCGEKVPGLRVLNFGGGDVDTATPMGSMVFMVMAALAQMELEIKRERITDSVAKRRAAGKDLGGRRPTVTDSQIRNAIRLIDGGEPATQVARDLGMSLAILYRRIRELPSPAIAGRDWRGWAVVGWGVTAGVVGVVG